MGKKKRRATISPSQLRAMNCRQQWYWGYKMGYKPKRSNINLEFGSGIHAALDHYYAPDPFCEPFTKDLVGFFTRWMNERILALGISADDLEYEAFQNTIPLGKAMLKGYLEEYPNEKDQIEVLATEKTIFRRLPAFYVSGEATQRMAPCDVVTRLDGIVRDLETGKLFSLEHKTYKSFKEKDLELDAQFTAQVWCGESYAESIGKDERIVGVIYNGLRKQMPGPRVKAPLFHRHKIYRNPQEIQAFLYRAYWQFKESSRWKIFPQPNPQACGMCDYREPCVEKQRGGDYQFLLDHNYNQRKETKNGEETRSGKKPARGRKETH